MNEYTIVQPQKTATLTYTPLNGGVLQRKCARGQHTVAGGKCAECRKKQLALQRRALNASGPETAPPIVHEVVRSSGQPLDLATRAFMEPRFGHDFSRVRVHTDARATESTRAVNARAYTVGRHIVFASDLYAPTTLTGVEVIAHELAHTIQQLQGQGPHTSPSYLRIAPPESAFEREANAIAKSVSSARLRYVNPTPDAEHYQSGENSGDGLSACIRHVGSPESLGLQRQEGPSEPLFPIPVFEEFDPVIIVPDIEGIPSFLRGKQVPLSTLRDALDVLRGRRPIFSGPGADYCGTLLPGYETVQEGEFAGLCCPPIRSRERCCAPEQIGPMSLRCCTREEVVVNGRCIKPRPAPLSQPPGPQLPSIPRLQLQFPRTRIGVIHSSVIDHFGIDRDSVPSNASAQLDHLASLISLYPDVEVHVEGHTDSSFTPEHNQDLAERRARAVRDALVQRGVGSGQITDTGFGEERLLYPEERTTEERAQNRRVEVWFYVPPAGSLRQRFRLVPPLRRPMSQ